MISWVWALWSVVFACGLGCAGYLLGWIHGSEYAKRVYDGVIQALFSKERSHMVILHPGTNVQIQPK